MPGSDIPNHSALPSEAEWEYACRGETDTRFYWGDDSDYSEIGDYVWYSGNSNSTTNEVGQKLPNDWGLHDMSGNVREWCEDWYHSDYTGAPVDGSAWVSPSSSNRVNRGGSWNNDARNCRAANRNNNSPFNRNNNLGFRLSRSR